MTIRKPNRVTTPQRAVLNGTRTSHASMPRARSRWQPGFTGNQASVPGQEELARPPEGRNPQEQEAEASGPMSDRLIVTAATGYSGRYPARTTGEAHLYRVTQYYDAWPFEPSSRVRAGTASRQRTETFRTLEPVRQRLARADLYARHQHRHGGDWAAFVAVAEQLTDHGWQPLDLDVLPSRPAAGRRGRAARSRRGTAPAGAGRDVPR